MILELEKRDEEEGGNEWKWRGEGHKIDTRQAR